MMIGFNMRHMPVCVKVRELLRSGTIGSLKAIWIRHFVGSGGDFYFHDWHAKQDCSNGLLLQKGSHDIDMVHWFTESYTQRVAAFGGLDYFGGNKPNNLTCDNCAETATCPEVQEQGHPRNQCAFRQEVDVEDNNIVIMELNNGVKAAYLQCHFTPEYLRNYTFIGTRGRIEMNIEKNEIFLLPRVSGRIPPEGPECISIVVDETEGGHGGADPLIARDFIEMLRDGKEPESPPIAGRMSVAAACAATLSIRNGGVEQVSIPPSGL
jgi:predicted dehydrogenase